jgi:hypothetical protein
MSLEDLIAIARGGLSESEALRKEAVSAFHRTAVATFRAGKALAIIRQKHVGTKNWGAWQEENGFKRSTVNQAIRLYRNAKRESAVKGLSVMAAKTAFQVLTPARTKPPTVSEAPPPSVPALSVHQADDSQSRGSGAQPDTAADHLTTLRSMLAMLESTLAACKATVAEADDDETRAEFNRLLGELADLVKQYQPTKAKAKRGRSMSHQNVTG